jgi:hypothetical protein
MGNLLKFAAGGLAVVSVIVAVFNAPYAIYVLLLALFCLKAAG